MTPGCSEIPRENLGNMKLIRRITWFGMLVNLFLSVLKFTAGVLGKSQVLVADAVHSLSDLVTDAAVLIGSRYWDRPADSNHPNGHAKIQSLVTLFIGIALGWVAVGLMKNAAMEIYSLKDGNQIPVPSKIALAAAVISIVVKEWLYQITCKAGKKAGSSAVIANAWHHRSDALSSIPAAVSVGASILFGEQWTFLDPIGTIVVSCMILVSAFCILNSTFATLLDCGETEEKIIQIKESAKGFPEILSIHKIRTRPLGGDKFAADLHIQVDPEMTVLKAHSLSHELSTEIKKRISDIDDVVVHIEPME